MSKIRNGAERPQAKQQHPPKLQSCICELGAHVLEILEDETAIIVKSAQLNETVSLEKEELYHLLLILQELFHWRSGEV